MASGPLKSGRVYSFKSWWSLDQLQLARDSSRRRKKETFTLRDAVDLLPKEAIKVLRLRQEGEDVIEGNLIAGGWDHEHCFLYWRKILPGGDDNDAGYSDGDKWLCEDCYEAYIASGLGRKLGE